ncbi:phage repressor protein [Paenibacillus albidus]|uniref:BRO-N domain-containing protein n=1 Tax=Paenibacillus albidus TaxID=2041023 RepID=UPI001BE8E7FB|nr:BRO family protein [Paenibacillus albidus]MBT2288003.1 phage repressor protein [Paenibacillus albidus]
MKLKTEKWLGLEIRFIEKTPGEWWAVATDVTKSLGIRNGRDALSRLPESQKGVALTDTLGGQQEVSIISEKGVYRIIMRSRRKEAEEFQDWVCDVLRSLRQSTGLEGFQVFRMLDKEHQREAMSNLNQSLRQPGKPDFIKANIIADKAVSNKFGHPKMLKKKQMTPDMLVARQPILDDTVNLMSMVDHFGIELSVSKTIYGIHN